MLYNDSAAQRLEYEKLGLVYEENEEDKAYQHALKQIQNDPNKKERITSMIRVAVAPGEEYIVYHHTWEGTNPIGSKVKTTQTNVGIYGKFDPIYERFITEDNTYGQKLVSKNTDTAYFIPFTKERAEELHKLCNDITSKPGSRTSYYVMPEGGTKITVESYKDWLNGNFEDLHANGKITTATQQPAAQIKTKS
jgi:hypothetical protein